MSNLLDECPERIRIRNMSMQPNIIDQAVNINECCYSQEVFMFVNQMENDVSCTGYVREDLYFQALQLLSDISKAKAGDRILEKKINNFLLDS